MRPVPAHPPPSADQGLIVVGGEALVDLIAQPDGELRGVLGGGPYNTARTIGRLGGRVSFLGGISTDRFGSQLADGLRADSVGDEFLRRTSLPSTLAMVELDDSGSATYSFYFEGTAGPALVPVTLSPDVVALHVGTLGLVLEPMASVLEDVVLAAGDRTLVMIDANCRPSATVDPAAYVERLRRLLPRTDVLKVSDDDLRFLAEHDSEMSTPLGLVGLGATVVLLTMASEGVDIVTSNQAFHVPAEPVEVVDTIGAGDSFGGGFLAWWIQSGWGAAELSDADHLRQAAAMGCRVAAITCGREGADPPHAHEVEGWAP